MPGVKRKAAKSTEEESTPKKLTVAQEKERARQWAEENMQNRTTTTTTSPSLATSAKNPPPSSTTPAPTRRGRPARRVIQDQNEEDTPVIRVAPPSSRKPAARGAPHRINTLPLAPQSPPSTSPRLTLSQEKERARLWAESQKQHSISPAPPKRESSVERKPVAKKVRALSVFSAPKHVVNVFHYCLESLTLVIELTFIAFAISAGIAYFSNETPTATISFWNRLMLNLAIENLIPVTIIYVSLMGIMVSVLAYGYIESFLTAKLQIPLLVAVVAGAIVYLKPELIQQFK
jgi:hypothetical protein